jgi:hypothetical protein
MSLPLPKHFRQYDLETPAYLVYAVVRYVGGPKIGVMFLGKFPPKGFQQDPGRRRFPVESGTARQFQRYEIAARVRIRRLEAPPGEVAEELTATENISRGGVMVMTSLPIKKGESVEVEEVGTGSFRTWATVQAVAAGADGRSRLGIMFTQEDAPVRSLEWLRRVGIPVDADTEQKAVQFERTVFEDCRQGHHTTCVAGAPAINRKFRVCSCSCHGPGRS